MKYLNKITTKLKKISKLKKAMVVMLSLLIVSSSAGAIWGPQRPAFDWNTPEGKKGSLTGPVFNSFKNSPLYNDEFNFTSARNINDNAYSNDLKVKAGDEVEFKVFIHNNANENTNASGLGIATGTYAGLDIPQNQFGVKNEPIGFVGASNAKPGEVFDGTLLSSANGKKFALDYIEGSAKLNILGGSKVLPLSDNFVSKNGTPIGSEEINGIWKGCFEYVGWVNVRVKVVGEKEDKPSYEIKKYVNGQDANENSSSVQVKSNEDFEYRIDVTNNGSVDLKNVKVWDSLPAGVTYTDNTLKLDGQTVTNDDDFFNKDKGVVIPSIAKGVTKSFTMKASIKGNHAELLEKCKPGIYYNNIATANPEGEGEGLEEKEDNAITRCAELPPTVVPSTGAGSLIAIASALLVAVGTFFTAQRLQSKN